MEYDISQLVGLTGWLSEQYTSKDVSSITYETAGMLMEAILYCIGEYEDMEQDTEGGAAALVKQELPDIGIAYKMGYEAVLEKVRRTREIYKALIKDFDDYGCRNYRDTITKGIPGFFVKYNAKFCPQDHILTLDYPVFGGNSIRRGKKQLYGVDLIYVYLQKIQEEKQFMDSFDGQAIMDLMRYVHAEYEQLYLDNLCEPVLLNALGCLIAGKPVGRLLVGRDGLVLIENYLADSCVKEIEKKIGPGIRALTRDSSWSHNAARHYAPQIENALRHNCLGRIFQV